VFRLAHSGSHLAIRRSLLPAVNPTALDAISFLSVAAIVCVRGDEGDPLGRHGLRIQAVLRRWARRPYRSHRAVQCGKY